MADPTDAYPEEATKGGRPRENGAGDGGGGGEGGSMAELEAALDEHGGDLAAALDRTDEAADLVETAIIVLASADEAEIEALTESTGNLVAAADGLTTEGAARLATDVGEHGDDLRDALQTVLALQRDGHLDDLTTIAAAFSESLSPDEVEELATMLEESGTETIEALDVVLALQREGQLEDLVALAGTLSALEIDADTAAGLNTVLASVGEAQRESEPVGLIGFLRGLASRDARAGLGYLLALLRGQGRRLRER